MTWWSQPGLIISIIKFHCGLSRSNCTVSTRSHVNCPLFNHTGQIHQQISHIEFEDNFPPQVYLENDKSSLCAEGPHHYNIFFLRVHPSSKGTQLFHSCSPWIRVSDPRSFSTLVPRSIFNIEHDTGSLTLTQGLQNKIFSKSCGTFEEECNCIKFIDHIIITFVRLLVDSRC